MEKAIDELRRLAGDVIGSVDLWSCINIGREADWCAKNGGETLRDRLRSIADRAEREHAEELEAKYEELYQLREDLAERRELTADAREVVDRLRALGNRVIADQEIYHAIDETIEFMDMLSGVKLRDRLIELIEHGGKQDVDVTALRELADNLENIKVTASSAKFASIYKEGCKYAANRIREAIDGVPERGNIVARCQPCRTKRDAAADWVDRQGGLDVVRDYSQMDEFVAKLAIDLGVSDDIGCGDDLRDAVKDELDKRLMPPGMEWPRFEDGEKVLPSDEGIIGIEHSRTGNTVLVTTSDDEPRVVLAPGERVKRPEPEVLGADGLPIKVGETVYLDAEHADMAGKGLSRSCFACGLHGVDAGTMLTVSEVKGADKVSFESDNGAWCPASWLTHTPPDTQESIDDDASMPPRRYYADKIGHDVGLKDDEEVFAAVARDLLRRQRELDARTMGSE